MMDFAEPDWACDADDDDDGFGGVDETAGGIDDHLYEE